MVSYYYVKYYLLVLIKRSVGKENARFCDGVYERSCARVKDDGLGRL
jgi:hypothetical protein